MSKSKRRGPNDLFCSIITMINSQQGTDFNPANITDCQLMKAVDYVWDSDPNICFCILTKGNKSHIDHLSKFKTKWNNSQIYGSNGAKRNAIEYAMKL
jgi:hypothetical protein